MAKQKPPTKEQIDKILHLISTTDMGTASICKDVGCDPAGFSVLKRTDDDLANRYARAKEDQADYLADQILQIADDDERGSDHKRLAIDARKWLAGKLRPKAYSDKVINEHTGPDGGPIEQQITHIEFCGPDDDSDEAEQ